MKKLLLASTILAVSAGAAAAEVTLSGDARMGIIDDFGAADVAFTSRARVTFTLSGESDAGFTFGASFRADNAGGAASGTAGSVFIAAGGLKFSMGDVDGAAAAAVGHVDGVGLTGLSDLNENLFIANGGISFPSWAPLDPNVVTTGDPSALLEYNSGAFSVYASVTNPGYTFDLGGLDFWDGDAYALGAAYTMGDYKFSAGWERISIDRIAAPFNVTMKSWILGTDATIGAVVLKARYGQGDIENGAPYADFDQYALSATYTANALSITGYASHKNWDFAAGTNLREVDAMGIGASYDLGGGAKVQGGIVRRGITAGAAAEVKDTAADLGLSFSF